jgi:hypothetical protein
MNLKFSLYAEPDLLEELEPWIDVEVGWQEG